MSQLKQKIKEARDRLVKELGIEDLSDGKKNEILNQIGDILQQKIVIKIVEELSNEKQEEFKTVIEKAKENPTEMDRFLEQNISDLEGLILKEIEDYKKEALSFIGGDFEEETKETVGVTEKQKLEEPKKESFTEKLVISEDISKKEETVSEEVQEKEPIQIEEDKEKQETSFEKEALEEAVEEQKEDLVEELEELEETKKTESEIDKNNQDISRESENIEEEKKINSQPIKETSSNQAAQEISSDQVIKDTASNQMAQSEDEENEEEIKRKLEEKFKPIQPDYGVGDDEKEDGNDKIDSNREKMNLEGLEKEQADKEAQILEENRIGNNQDSKKELDISKDISNL